jgi:hypothetical protein
MLKGIPVGRVEVKLLLVGYNSEEPTEEPKPLEKLNDEDDTRVGKLES